MSLRSPYGTIAMSLELHDEAEDTHKRLVHFVLSYVLSKHFY